MARPKGSKNRKKGAAPATDDGTDPNLNHNSAARADYINKNFGEMYALRREIDAAKTTHVKPLADSLTKVRRQIKTDLGFTGKDINIAFAVYERERLAGEFEDAGERDTVFDTLREIFSSLRKGDQLNFLDGMTGGDEPAEGEQDTRPRFLQNEEAAGTA